MRNEKNLTYKIIETYEEALEAYSLYSETHYNHSPYYECMKKSTVIGMDKELFSNYHIRNINRVINQKLGFICIDQSINKIVGFILGEDLFEESNPDFPEIKPKFAQVGMEIYQKSLHKFVENGIISRGKGVYLAISKVSTDKDYWGNGICPNLFALAEKVGKERGFKLIYTDPATIIFQRIMAKKIKYPQIGKVLFKEIVFENEYVFENIDFGEVTEEPAFNYNMKEL